jgi:hypothetical protein
MIKTFEQFVFTMYGKSVNEAFQSKKLSELVKKHGKPRDRDFSSVHSYVNNQYLKKRALYDIKDSDIIDVVSKERVNANTHHSRDYRDSNNNYMPTKIIELEDGTCVIVRDGVEYDASVAHKERHRGNLGKDGGDDIHQRHLKNVQRIKNNRLGVELEPYMSEIIDAVEKIMEGLGDKIDSYCEHFNGYKINLGEKEYLMDITCYSDDFDDNFSRANDRGDRSFYFSYTLDDVWIRDDENQTAISLMALEDSLSDEDYKRLEELFEKKFNGEGWINYVDDDPWY